MQILGQEVQYPLNKIKFMMGKSEKLTQKVLAFKVILPFLYKKIHNKL